MCFILLILLAYISGSIPTSILLGKILRGVDVRQHGSCNPGATNTFRVLGKQIGITVGLIDIFKGFFAVYFLPRMLPCDVFASEEIRMISAGLAVVAGHVWTVFAGFKGGKGVGTSFGVFAALAPLPSLITMIVWCALTFGTGYVSLGSICAAVTLPVAIIAQGYIRHDISIPITVIALILALLIVVRHRSNISRLLKGEENRFGKRGKK